MEKTVFSYGKEVVASGQSPVRGRQSAENIEKRLTTKLLTAIDKFFIS
jgi:hypothetical protein